MKNVGILSMQRIINYGSFLQAYALKQLLLENGAENVYFIDIKPGTGVNKVQHNILVRAVLFVFRLFGKVFSGSLMNYLREKKFQDKIAFMFKNKFFPMLELDKHFTGTFDLVIIGSDEVFNCTQKCKWGFTMQLFGDIPNARKVVSYAGSFGHSTYEQIVEMGYEEQIRKGLQNLKAISVRDDNSLFIIHKILPDSSIPVFVHIDPVLVYDYASMLSSYPIRQKDYIVIYSYNGRIKSSEEISAIRSFARKRHLKICTIYSSYPWGDETIYPKDPFEVIAYFKNAAYIVTDTFHGAILSIITKSRFCVLIRDSNRQKLSSLLTQFHLDSRNAMSPDALSGILDSPINYDEVRIILAQYRSEANQYLKQVLAEQ